MTQTYTFHVSGMHCKACTILIEESIKEFPGVETVRVSLSGSQVVVTGAFTDSAQSLAQQFTAKVSPHGYAISAKKVAVPAKWGEFVYAVPAALVVIVAFIGLQKMGIGSFGAGTSVTYGTAIIIGLVASVSSCLAIVGGLVLSLSANAAKEGATWRTQALFHVGRIGGFLILGGLLGYVGTLFHLGLTANVVLGILVALVMFVLGVNLLDVFDLTKKFQVSFPAVFSRHLVAESRRDHYLAPALIGVGTFFLPCGFTQSMQLYALTTGSIMQGALTMFFFSLGTFPMLALLSFSSLSITNKPWKGVFFKAAGIIVILLALLNMSNALATAGIISPLFSI